MICFSTSLHVYIWQRWFKTSRLRLQLLLPGHILCPGLDPLPLLTSLALVPDDVQGNHAARDIVEVGLHLEPLNVLVTALAGGENVAVLLREGGVVLRIRGDGGGGRVEVAENVAVEVAVLAAALEVAERVGSSVILVGGVLVVCFPLLGR